MDSDVRYNEGIDSVAVIGNYLPRLCGIATFTTDLVGAISAESPDINCWAVAMNDKPEEYAYPGKVRFVVYQNRLTDYSMASEFLNISQIDIVCVQHEYGIFGTVGSDGLHFPLFHYPPNRIQNPYIRTGGSQPSIRGSIPRSATLNLKLSIFKMSPKRI